MGKIHNSEVKKYANKKNIKIKYFFEYIQTNLYEKYLLKTDYLIAFFSNKKYDGEKLSGIFQDSLRFGIPVITNLKNVGNIFFTLTIFDVLMDTSNVLDDLIVNKKNNIEAAMKNSEEFDKSKAMKLIMKNILS